MNCLKSLTVVNTTLPINNKDAKRSLLPRISKSSPNLKKDILYGNCGKLGIMPSQALALRIKSQIKIVVPL